MKYLGIIKHLQIQRDHLKVGQSPNRIYRPDPLMSVMGLKLTDRGVFGLSDNPEVIVDVHHIDHPHSRNRGNENGVSINFTAHYTKMRQYFGTDLKEGEAGENILIENDTHLTMYDLGQRIAIQSQQTGEHVYLNHTIPAPPCAEFSIFAAQQPLSGEAMKSALQFLDDGMRGFYTSLQMHNNTSTSRFIIQVGDPVFALYE